MLLLALAIRTLRAWQEPVVNPDTIRFIDQAKEFTQHPLEAVRREVYHPLHSIAGLGVHTLIGPWFSDDRAAWLWSMEAVGIIAGSLVALEIVWLSRLCGAPFWASFGAGFVWIVGRRTSAFGADGLSDMLYLAFFTLAMILAMYGMRGLTGMRRWGGRNAALMFAAGLSTGLAYLTRPEGLGAALIVAVTITLMALPRPKTGRWRGGRAFKLFARRRAAPGAAVTALGLLLLGTAIPAVPYMAAIGALTHKVATAALPAGAPAVAGLATFSLLDVGAGASRMVMELWETFGFGPWLTVLLALPLRMRLWGRPRLRLTIVVWSAVWVAVMMGVVLSKGYLDGRHTLALQVVLHAVLAIALSIWASAVRVQMLRARERGTRAAWTRWKRLPLMAGGLACLLAATPGMIRLQLAPLNDQFYIAEAAVWIRSNIRPNVVVCDSELRIGYYSDHPYALWEGPTKEGDLRLAEVELARHGPNGERRPAVVGEIFRPGIGQSPQGALGPYREIMRWNSDAAAHGDVLVLYALPTDDVFIAPRPATAPASVPVTAPQH